MARRAEGWKLVRRGRIFRVRFSYQGRRYEITTGETDSGKAQVIAAQVYADVISGRVTVSNSGTLVHPSTPLAELCADWIAAIEPELGRDTSTTYTVYAKHWVEFFKTIGSVNTGNAANYSRARLGQVQRGTVIKELSALRRFLRWAFEQGVLREVPEIKAPAKKATGKRHPQGRKAPVHLTPEQCDAILAKLPVESKATKGKRWPLRARFEFAYETALRPETIDQLKERDFTPFGLHIRPEVDKNRWERTVPLSDRAAVIAGEHITGDPDRLVFGRHDRRESWRAAAVAVLGEAGKRVNPYDLKHARVTRWIAEGKSVLGIQFLTGTKQALNRYALPSRAEAESVFRGDSGASSVLLDAKERDRTSTGVTPLAPQASSNAKTAAQTEIKSAGNGRSRGNSGAAPQIEFRRLALAWFRRAAA